MKTPRLSVIVPVFNTSTDAFEECCRSIVEQTETDYEVIVVDDASDSPYAEGIVNACHRYGFKLIKNGRNLGVSLSRNRAMVESKGEYLTFIDADDCVYPDFFEDALTIIDCAHADCVIGRLWQTPPDVYLPERKNETSEQRLFVGPDIKYVMKGTLAGRDFLPLDVKRKRSFAHAGPCGRIYRRASIDDITFDNALSTGEDIAFNLDVLSRATACILVDRTWYQYKQHDSSATNNITQDAIDAQICFSTKLCDSKLVSHCHLQQEAYGRILSSLKVVIGKGIMHLPVGNREKLEKIGRILALPPYAEALACIQSNLFALSVKDRVFVLCGRMHRCRTLLRLFSFDASIGSICHALRSGAIGSMLARQVM